MLDPYPRNILAGANRQWLDAGIHTHSCFAIFRRSLGLRSEAFEGITSGVDAMRCMQAATAQIIYEVHRKRMSQDESRLDAEIFHGHG